MERILENAMYASRWLLAPIYFGLSLGLLALALKFFQEVVHVLPNVFALSEADLILVILSLIDMSLVGGLLVMVMISGYENFVSQLDIKEGTEKLSWLGKMDSSSLKMKVAASIVAISSIHLLKVFMNAQNIPDSALDPDVPSWMQSAVRLNRELGAFPLTGNNSADLEIDYEASIASMAADVRTARESVHVLFYIMGLDETTEDFFAALEERAAGE